VSSGNRFTLETVYDVEACVREPGPRGNAAL
jgi:hypothetical protein